ncbi:MAG TPA: ABC transporter ATP-binding protein [Opitutaceae bacterium]|jgi:ABC-2 type transport system ATP-binding protein|nr:ABC transporter ATP-binding protein [Opitutaceae bacterium]
MMNAIASSDLRRRYGRTAAVDGLNLSVPLGSIYAFLGPNGAGKTTTIKMLLNLLRPTSGSSEVLGTPSQRLGPAEFTRIGYVSENQQMPEWMTLRQLIAFCRPLYPTWNDPLCHKLVSSFELPLDIPLRHLSRGMRMKAALLVALAYRPKLLVMDEPFTGLDALVRDEVISGMLEVTEQEQWTVFISSHDIDEVERLADWVGILDGGHMYLSESAAALQARFRRMEAVTVDPARLPARPPKSWLAPDVTPHRFTVVETEYVGGASEQRVADAIAGAEQIAAAEMTLREIFLALARTFRIRP